MKKSFLFVIALLTLSTSVKNVITAKERADASKLLKDTENGVFAKVKGLSDAQLKFKPAPDRWSVEECLMHIAASEKALWGMVATSLKQPATPEKRADVKSTDEQVVQMLESRAQKVKTITPLEPQNTGFKTSKDALASFKVSREKLIAFVKMNQDDLRNHVVVMPFATFDCYQMVLFIGAHSNRHTQQIAEVMADPKFPKK